MARKELSSETEDNVMRALDVENMRPVGVCGSDVRPLVSWTFALEEWVEALGFAAQGLPRVVKTQIVIA